MEAKYKLVILTNNPVGAIMLCFKTRRAANEVADLIGLNKDKYDAVVILVSD